MTYRKHRKTTSKRQAKICRVGSLVIETITPICQQNGFIQARILLEWDYIVTPQFSQFCIPLKVTFPLKQRHNGRLLVKATSSMAAEIIYLEPLILSRINQYFGYQAISKVSLIQGPVAKTPLPQKLPKKPLPEAIQKSLEDHTQLIEDERLRTALLSLGMEISQQKNTS